MPKLTNTGLVWLATIALCGCSGDVLNSGFAEPAAPPPARVVTASITAAPTLVVLKPLVGALEPFKQQIEQRLNETATKSGLAVMLEPTGEAGYSLSGYMVVEGKGKAAKLSYIWDVTDATGKRLSRTTGSETLAATATEPWASVPPEKVQIIADRAIAQLAALALR